MLKYHAEDFAFRTVHPGAFGRCCTDDAALASAGVEGSAYYGSSVAAAQD